MKQQLLYLTDRIPSLSIGSAPEALAAQTNIFIYIRPPSRSFWCNCSFKREMAACAKNFGRAFDKCNDEIVALLGQEDFLAAAAAAAVHELSG
jgi:hypothetical protein